MKRLTFEFATMILMFFGIWFLLSRINYTESKHFKHVEKINEEKFGELIFDFIKQTNRVIESDSASFYLKKIKDRICENNGIDADNIEFHLVYNSEINAFALPGRKVVIYSGLIDYCETPEELASVLAHEIAHIEKDHIMKKMVKEISISVIMAVIGGNGSGEMIRQIASVVSSRAFDRDMEEEADETAVEYLTNASIDPEHFSNLMLRLSNESFDIPDYLEWSSTHPDTKARSVIILEHTRKYDFERKPLFDSKSWNNVKNDIDYQIDM